MRRTLVIPALAGSIILAANLAAIIPAAAQAAVACNERALVAAINLANSSGGGDVPLTPGCTYRLTRSHGSDMDGPDGLPVITTAISLTGSANVITRSATALPFRIAEVSATGSLTLTSVTLSNGSTLIGDGGGILNFGAVALTGGGLTGNTTLAGNGGGIASVGMGAAAMFTTSTLSGNFAIVGNGGGLYSRGGTATLTGTPVSSNRALLGHGGGIDALNAALTLTDSPVTDNAAAPLVGDGGGVFRTDGNVTVTTSPISANTPNNCRGSVPEVPACARLSNAIPSHLSMALCCSQNYSKEPSMLDAPCDRTRPSPYPRRRPDRMP